MKGANGTFYKIEKKYKMATNGQSDLTKNRLGSLWYLLESNSGWLQSLMTFASDLVTVLANIWPTDFTGCTFHNNDVSGDSVLDIDDNATDDPKMAHNMEIVTFIMRQ